MHRTPATALHFFFWWLHDSLTGLSSSGISTGQNSRTPNMLHDRYKTDSFHPGIQVHFGDRYPGSVLVVDPHPSQGEKLTFIFRPWHDSQQLTIRVSSSFNILEICKNNVWFQSWCRVHESQSISRWEESSDSNLPPIPCLLTTKCSNCKWNWSAGEQPPKICNLSDLSDSDMQHQSLQSWDPSHQAILIQKNMLEGFWISGNHQSTKAECEKGWKKWNRYQ